MHVDVGHVYIHVLHGFCPQLGNAVSGWFCELRTRDNSTAGLPFHHVYRQFQVDKTPGEILDSKMHAQTGKR